MTNSCPAVVKQLNNGTDEQTKNIVYPQGLQIKGVKCTKKNDLYFLMYIKITNFI